MTTTTIRILASTLFFVLLPWRVVGEGPAPGVDGDGGPVPRGWALGPALFFSSGIYEDRDAVLLPVPTVYFRGKPCTIYIERLDCRLARVGKLGLSAVGDLRLSGYGADDSPVLDGMESRNPSLDLGLNLDLETRAGLLELDLLTDALDNHRGQEIGLSWQVPILLERWLVRPALGIQWKSAELADYYWGVRPEEARLARPAYEVGGTLTSSLTVVSNYRMSENWLLMILGDFTRYGNAIRESPIVRTRAQFQAFVGLAHVF